MKIHPACLFIYFLRTSSHRHSHSVKTAQSVNAHYMAHKYRSRQINIGSRIKHYLMLIISPEPTPHPSSVDIRQCDVESISIGKFFTSVCHLNPKIGIRIIISVSKPKTEPTMHKRVIVVKRRINRHKPQCVAIRPPFCRDINPTAIFSFGIPTRSNRRSEGGDC